jgi:hypothetical protein
VRVPAAATCRRLPSVPSWCARADAAGVIDRKPNAAPNDPDAYVLRDHFSSCVGASTHIS